MGESEKLVQKARRSRTPPLPALQKSKVPKLKVLGKNLKKSKVPKFQKLYKEKAVTPYPKDGVTARVGADAGSPPRLRTRSKSKVPKLKELVKKN